MWSHKTFFAATVQFGSWSCSLSGSNHWGPPSSHTDNVLNNVLFFRKKGRKLSRSCYTLVICSLVLHLKVITSKMNKNKTVLRVQKSCWQIAFTLLRSSLSCFSVLTCFSKAFICLEASSNSRLAVLASSSCCSSWPDSRKSSRIWNILREKSQF